MATKPRKKSSKSLLKGGVDKLRKLTRAETIKATGNPNTRTVLYASKDAKKITKRTPTVSERQYDKAVTGKSREQAVKERSVNPLLYKSAASRDTADKIKAEGAYRAEFLQRVEEDARNRTKVKKAGGKNKGAPSFTVRRTTALTALEDRAKRLRGEHIPDGRYQQMMDYSAHYNDPRIELMRGSPKVKGSRILI
jgi:hypothetical protein